MYKFILRHRDPLGSNILDPRTFVQGMDIDAFGVKSGDDTKMHSAKMSVTPGQIYQVHKTTGLIDTAVFYDVVGLYKGGDYADVGLNTITVPAGAYYMLIAATSELSGQPTDELGLTLTAGSDFEPFYTSKEVFPIYNKLARSAKIESNNQYYTETIDGTIKLLKKDYDYVMALPFDTKMLFQIVDTTGRLSNYDSYFFKTDCKFDQDDKIIELKLTSDDHYSKITSGLQKTYNLIPLAPAMESVTIRRRPLIQVYIPGDKVITNILGGTYWEQPLQIDPLFNDADITPYHFYNAKNIRSIPVVYAPGLSTNVTGIYNLDNTSASGLYKLVFDEVVINSFQKKRKYSIVLIGQTITGLQKWEDYALYKTPFTTTKNQSVNSLLFTGANGDTGTFYFTDYRIYVRYCTDLLTVRGVNTYQIPSEDIVSNNSNYSNVIGYNITNFYIYEEYSKVPTKWGKVPGDAINAGEYYKEFLVSVITGLSNPVPIAPSNWKTASLWFFNDLDVRYTEFVDGQDFELRDAYPLHSVISKLLETIGSTITFDATEEYSEFLYAAVNPMGGFEYLDFEGGTLATDYAGNLNLFITPKSNIISADYTQPAQKADISLNQVLDLLKNTLKLYWHISGGKLRFEHISWYQNGGNYAYEVVGADLTALINPRNGKNWGFNQNKWNYEKESMPERLEYGWMDNVSPPFEGFNINILSNYVQEGKIEDVSISGFTTDIDFIQANPTEISRTGFCLLGAVLVGGKYRMPFIEMDLGYNELVIMQNGFLSFLYLLPRYHTYDLPSDNVNINNEDTTLYQNKTRQKKQEIKYPMIDELNPYELVKTDLGNGMVDKITVDLSSLMITGTIKHDTE
jgi:hypothetical protein